MEYPEFQTEIFGRMESAPSLLPARVASYREKTSATQIQPCKQATGSEIAMRRGERIPVIVGLFIRRI